MNNISQSNKKGNVRRIAIYLRKSRADAELEALGQGETLARHEAAITALCKRDNVDPRFTDTYREIVSGDSIAARPEMCRLLDAVEHNQYAAVYCMEIERLARGDGADQSRIIKAFSTSRTEIRTPAKVYDLTTESDENYAEFGLFLSRFEYKTIKRRLQAGRQASINEGVYQSQTPFGYMAINTGRSKILKPDPETAPFVLHAFKRRIDGASFYAIACELTDMDSEHRIKNWSSRFVSEIIRRKAYMGIQSINGEDRPFNCEPLISEDLFYAANAVPRNNSTRNGLHFANPLSGLLRCRTCGYIMIMKHMADGRKQYAHNTPNRCPSAHASAAPKVFELIDAAIREEIINFDIRLEESDGALLVKLNHELDEQHRRRSRLLDSFEADDGLYTVDEYLTRKKAYDARIAALQEQISAESEKSRETTEDKRLAFYAALEENDPEMKNKLLKSIIDRIDYSRTSRNAEIDIDVYFK